MQTAPEVIEATYNVMADGYDSLNNCSIPPLFDDWATVAEYLQTAVNNAANGADVKAELDNAAKLSEDYLKEMGYFD